MKWQYSHTKDGTLGKPYVRPNNANNFKCKRCSDVAIKDKKEADPYFLYQYLKAPTFMDLRK